MEDKNKNNQISCYIKDFFKERNISQKDIQNDLGVSQQYVSGLINGKRSIGKKLAEKLSELYGLDKSILLTGEALDLGGFNQGISEIKNLPHDKQMEVLNKKLDYIIKSEDLNRIYLKTLLAFHDIKIDMFESKENELEQLKKTVN